MSRLVWMLGLVLLAGMLAGCSEDGAETNTPPAEETRSEAPETPDETARPKRAEPKLPQVDGPGAKAVFQDWSAVIVAGDNRAAGGLRTQGFDNTRRRLKALLPEIGFDPENIATFSVNPQIYADETPFQSTMEEFKAQTTALRERVTGGCLFYFTSHGIPKGIVMGGKSSTLLSPEELRTLIEGWCGTRPTILFVSACYSGVFAKPEMFAPNRMIMTASVSTRTSFGCGVDDLYPYFDECVLQSLPESEDFVTAAIAVRDCVAERESAQNIQRSHPQISIGPEIMTTLRGAQFPWGE